MKSDTAKLIMAWIIVISIFWALTREKGIYYEDLSDDSQSYCISDYMGSCN